MVISFATESRVEAGEDERRDAEASVENKVAAWVKDFILHNPRRPTRVRSTRTPAREKHPKETENELIQNLFNGYGGCPNGREANKVLFFVASQLHNAQNVLPEEEGRVVDSESEVEGRKRDGRDHGRFWLEPGEREASKGGGRKEKQPQGLWTEGSHLSKNWAFWGLVLGASRRVARVFLSSVLPVFLRVPRGSSTALQTPRRASAA